MSRILLEIPLELFLLAVVVFLFSVNYLQKRKIRYFEKNKLFQKQCEEISKKLKISQEELERKKEVAEKIPVIIRMLSQNLPPNAIPATVVRFAKNFFHASRVGYFIPDENSHEFVLQESSGFPPDVMRKIRLQADEGILGTALQKKMVVSKNDPFVSTGMRRRISSFEREGIILDFVAPIYLNSNITGALILAGCGVDLNSEKQNVAMLADLFSFALKNAVKNEFMEKSISRDYLTGLYNRRFFADWFETEIRRAKNYLLPISIFLFDIDNFKMINDTYGHHAGDLVLRKLSKVTQRHTRSSDIVARYGGEEFVVVMTSSDKEQAVTYANNLKEVIANTEISLPDCENPLCITVSGGIASFPNDGESTTDLIKAADHALYEAKKEGRDKVLRA